jgi:hypothetical protein
MNVPHNVATQYALISYLVDEFHSKSGGVALTKTANSKSGNKAKPGAQAELIRKRPSTDAKPVYVKELVVVSQDMYGEGGGGLIVATDGGAMW